MTSQDVEALLHEAENRYRLKIFENISEEAVARLPLFQRLQIVGKALMYRTDYNGFVLGRQLLSLAQEMEC